MANNNDAPKAQILPHALVQHGHTRTDNYYWLRERDNPDTIAYLEAENAYTKKELAHIEGLENKLFEEIKGRIKETDMSVPYKKDDYYYYTRFEEGKEYPIHARKRDSLNNPELLMLNVNTLAEGHEFFSVGGRAISFGQDLLAYAVDNQGRRIYTIHFKNLATGELLEDVIPDVTGNMTWANDDQTLFYSKQDPETLRSFRIFRHILGTDPTKDELIYEETDATFSTYVFKTKSKKFLMIASSQTLSDEYRYLDADDPMGEFSIFLPRARDHEYSLEHFEDRFFIYTNDQAKNFRLMATPVNQTAKENWQEVIPHRTDVLLENFEIFKDHLVLEERHEGLIRIRIIPWNGAEEHYLVFDEPAYLAHVSINPEFNTPVLRYGYTSMTTPGSVYDYDMVTRERTLLKQEEVLGDFDSAQYETRRLHAVAKDGVKVPISLVYRKGLDPNGQSPLLLYGYGSYGHSLDASFGSARLSLLDRGFVFAIAHIRGGEEMGRQWYDDGKLLKKSNTFTDFITCGEHLIEQRYTSHDRMFAMGGSAGGLLMGAVINLRPDLFKGAVAQVPFVDVVTTMLDPTIPLTTGEYDEWGNPNDKQYYDYMLSYSPYDNVEAKDYPHLLITTGLHDSQVQYWEPAKWVAKLRSTKTDNNRLVLKTNMEAGHGGASGRFKRYREVALDYAFILDLAGIRE